MLCVCRQSRQRAVDTVGWVGGPGGGGGTGSGPVLVEEVKGGGRLEYLTVH
jgi:hypothetical protein